MLGVIGGMGPLATADFFRKLIDATPARDDDRAHPGADPLGAAGSVAAGGDPARRAVAAAGPARGARPPAGRGRHDAGDAVQHRAPLVRRPRRRLRGAVRPHRRRRRATCFRAGARELGIVATRATLRARVFERRLAGRGIALAAPDEATYDRAVQPAIDAVKRGAPEEGGRLLEPVIAAELDARRRGGGAGLHRTADRARCDRLAAARALHRFDRRAGPRLRSPLDCADRVTPLL